MKLSKLKSAILQTLVKNSKAGLWTCGRTLDELHGCSDRQRKAVIEYLHFDGWPVIVHPDKTKGYKITYDKKEQREYYNRREAELKKQFASLKIMRAAGESGELWMQDFTIENEFEGMVNA